jgi:hypothetical protein
MSSEEIAVDEERNVQNDPAACGDAKHIPVGQHRLDDAMVVNTEKAKRLVN